MQKLNTILDFKTFIESSTLNPIPLTIGICGERLSGKDTIGFQLEEELNLIKFALADPIKEQYSQLVNLPIQDLYTQGSAKEYHRIGLITLGMLRRTDHQDWWCIAAHNRIQEMITQKQIEGAVITDIRFKNEVEYFKENSTNFILIEVKASEDSKIKRGWHPSFADKTATEKERNEFIHLVDYTLYNNTTKQQLYRDINTVITKFNLAQQVKEL